MVGQKFHFYYRQSVRRVLISRAFQRKRPRSPTLETRRDVKTLDARRDPCKDGAARFKTAVNTHHIELKERLTAQHGFTQADMDEVEMLPPQHTHTRGRLDMSLLTDHDKKMWQMRNLICMTWGFSLPFFSSWKSQVASIIYTSLRLFLSFPLCSLLPFPPSISSSLSWQSGFCSFPH